MNRRNLTIDLKEARKSIDDSSDCKGGFLKELEDLGENTDVKYFEVNDGDCGGVPSYVLKGYCKLTN
ncbi:MAG TPA: hypothetical protein DCL41_02760 [Bdellovibrionales bacterium]|nr:hypothetical protein [Pseudobdellovibrionaceae bacterium]HAG90762.1 hypothetical protein [Bdellovibrionales bacterium]